MEEIYTNLECLRHWGPIKDSNHHNIVLVCDQIIIVAEVVWHLQIIVFHVCYLYLNVVVINQFFWEVSEIKVDFGYLQWLDRLSMELVLYAWPNYIIVSQTIV